MFKTNIVFHLAAGATLLGQSLTAQTYDTNNVMVQTFAGYGIPGYVDGQGQLTAFNAPAQIVSDTASNLYVLDNGNHRIRKITPTGTVSTFAGGGANYEGYGTNVSLAWGQLGTMVIDHNNTLWLVLVSGYSGSAFFLTVSNNGYVSIENGGLTNLAQNSGLCFDPANHLYYSGGNQIYRYYTDSGMVEAIAGSGIAGNFDGVGTLFSAFNNPTALTCDQANNLYVWDSGNQTIRRIDASRMVTTITGSGYYSNNDGVGTNAYFSSIASMFTDNAGKIYLICGSCVREMDVQTNVETLAGNFYQYSSNFANGAGNVARFANASGGCLAQGMIFVADTGNNRIRNITFNQPAQLVPAASLQLNTYAGLQLTGTVGRTYQIQSSLDMSTWNTAGTVILPSSPYLWIDPNPVSGNKFYRAVLLP